jgi:hypothetical protein
MINLSLLSIKETEKQEPQIKFIFPQKFAMKQTYHQTLQKINIKCVISRDIKYHQPKKD